MVSTGTTGKHGGKATHRRQVAPAPVQRKSAARKQERNTRVIRLGKFGGNFLNITSADLWDLQNIPKWEGEGELGQDEQEPDGGER